MATNSATNMLQDIIRATLGRQQLTKGQLLGQLNTDGCRALKLGMPRLSQVLGVMVRNGELAHVDEQTASAMAVRRFYVPEDAYSAEPPCGTPGWVLVRYDDEGRAAHSLLGVNLTEADARTCAAALNERDRKVRKIKGATR